MATDFFVAQFWIPMFVITLVVITAYFFVKKHDVENEFKGITAKRIFFGAVSSLLASIIYSGISALQLGLNKVELGHISYSELSGYYLGYWIYDFVLFSPFMLGGLVIIGIPILYALYKVRFASFLGIVLVALVMSSLRGADVLYSPYNIWCSTNAWQCVLNNFFDFFIACAVVGIGFGIGARLPMWRNKIE